MPQCSFCPKYFTGLIYKFEQCSAHCFCFECFINIKSIEALNCNDCNRVILAQPLSPQLEACFYCSQSEFIDTCENKHSICSTCIQNKETYIDCYYCYLRFFTFCFSCQTHLTSKIPIPDDPRQSKCIECFRLPNQNANFNLNTEITTKRTSFCRLCNKQMIYVKICEIHGCCIQCAIILQVFQVDTNIQIINCSDCVRNIPKIDMTNTCSTGLNCQNELIPILACRNHHKSCNNCFGSEVDTQRFACRDCRVYFELRKSQKIKCCTICFHNSSKLSKKMCKYHYICEFCEKLLKNFPEVMKLDLIKCKDCLIKSTLKANPIALKSRKCQQCDQNQAIDIGCPVHEFCKNCLKFSSIFVADMIENCLHCNEFISKGCRVCFKLTDNPRPFMCKYTHIYCFNCIKNRKIFNDTTACNECKDYLNKESSEKNKCLQCIGTANIKSSCNQHSICSDCLLTSSDLVKITITNCKKCRDCLQYKCFKCNGEIGNFKCLSDCKAQHMYCDFCIRDLRINYGNNNCKDCNGILQKTGLIIFKGFCDRCGSVEKIPKFCKTHDFCLKCFTLYKIQLLKDCKSCNDLLFYFCINCAFEFTEDSLKLQFPACENKHFYCENCFHHLRVTKSIKCSSCKYENKNCSNTCNLCMRQNSKVNLCSSHNVCDKCFSILNSNTGKIIVDLLDCVECKSLLMNQANKEKPLRIPIETNMNPFIAGNPVQNFDFELNSHMNPNSQRSNYSDFNPPLNKLPILCDDESQVPPSMAIIIQANHIENSISVNPPNNNPNSKTYTDLNTKKNKNTISSKQVLCKKCKIKYLRLKCNHAQCDLCFNNQFSIKFSSFLKALFNKDVNALKKKKDYSLSCPEIGCSNKYCFPFDLFFEISYKLTANYFQDDIAIRKFLLHYEGFFEGIDYTFNDCYSCKYFMGKAEGQVCFWCNHY